MECEKCQDRGFTEQEHGLIMVLCDCEKGKMLREEITGEMHEETFVEVTAEANAFANAIMPKLEGEDRIDSNSGTGQPDKSIGSEDTSQPKRTRKPKKKKGTRKRAS